MIQPAIGSGPFNGVECAGLLYHENSGLIAPGVETVFTQLAFGNIPTLATEREAVFDGTNGVGQPQRLFPFSLQQMKGQTLRGFLPDPRQTDQLSHQPSQQTLLINSHRD